MKVDALDYQILNLFVDSEEPLTSWNVANSLFPEAVPRKLPMIIYRLKKLAKTGLLDHYPSPRRKDQRIYKLNPQSLCLDGTVFIPSKAGGLVVNCKYYEKGCPGCVFGSEQCKLYGEMKEEGTLPFLKLLEISEKEDVPFVKLLAMIEKEVK